MSAERYWYYLHTNGELISKIDLGQGPPEGDFVRKSWPLVTTERESAWIICLEALAMGARRERVMELAALWKLTDEDALVFAENVDLLLSRDGDKWCATYADFVDLQESEAGFGVTCLEALANLRQQFPMPGATP